MTEEREHPWTTAGTRKAPANGATSRGRDTTPKPKPGQHITYGGDTDDDTDGDMIDALEAIPPASGKPGPKPRVGVAAYERRESLKAIARHFAQVEADRVEADRVEADRAKAGRRAGPPPTRETRSRFGEHRSCEEQGN